VAKRTGIGPKMRFEVFKRDKFTCQYCGRSAPDVILNADHIKPVAEGGKNSMINLITSCFDCNSGKGKRELSDDTEAAKQKRQLDDLQERRNQIDMMLSWHEGVSDLTDYQAETFLKAFQKKVKASWEYKDAKKREVKIWLRKYSIAELLESLDISVDQYLSAEYNNQNIVKVWDYTLKIARSRKTMRDKPYMEIVFQISTYVKTSFYNAPKWGIVNTIESYYLAGVSADYMKRAIKEADDYEEFLQYLNNGVNKNGGN
jgi:hypothetical protein